MSKGAETREMILRKAAPVFNRRGYAGASLSDIMAATGLEKGGIYNHFSSKEELALHAFDYAYAQVREAFRVALQGKRHAIERLEAITTVFQAMPDGMPVAGGCPVLNTAIEADDTNPALRARARAGMEEWHALIVRIVTRGIERGEVRADVDPEALATLMIAVLEGAIMLSKLRDEMTPMNQAVAFLLGYLQSAVRA